MIEFGEWLPDLPALENPGATEAKNVIPHGKSYRPFTGLAEYSDALAARCQGVAHGRDNDGNIYLFAGDANSLYRLSGTAWADVSVASGYTCASDSQWRFAQSMELLVATQIGDPIQSFELGTSSAFADLSASAPRARYIANLRDFLVVGNTYDAVDGAVPFRVRWSAIGDPTDWTVSATTQADYQDLTSANGWITGVLGGEFGIIFQERAITRMSYVGSPAIFQFDEIEGGRGTQASGSIIRVGPLVAYLGEDGFYFFDGTSSTPISHNKVSKTFYADLDQSYMYRITSAVDPINQVVFWAYPGSGNVDGNPNKVIMFNYSPTSAKRWSWAEIDTELIARLAIPSSYTLETLDSVGTLDELPFSLDSRAWIGNSVVLAAFDQNHKLSLFTGGTLPATLETGEAEINPGRRTRLSRVRPIIDGCAATVQVGQRDKPCDSVTWGAATSLNDTGDACVRSNARYHRVRVNTTGDFNHAQGIDVVESTAGGKR